VNEVSRGAHLRLHAGRVGDARPGACAGWNARQRGRDG
jgi:hypothetical protein